MAEELSLHVSSPGCPDDVIVSPCPHRANLSDESLRGPQALSVEHSIPEGQIEVESQQFSICSCEGACNCRNTGSISTLYAQYSTV